ncbi:tyrosine-type recombinase/integrase [Pedobacter sp.]|uniref:tyrosine-type recombinase/integrase n=1 Tax=Pedobacter sp. TaxID=1411316 RepID=UPI003BAC2ADA
MFTAPQISTNDDLKSRSFIYFYYNNIRYKFYNGNKINVTIFPNHAKTLKERNKLLINLQNAYSKALHNSWNPINGTETPQEINSIRDLFGDVLTEKISSPYSKFYKRDLKKICEQFLSYLPKSILEKDIKELPFSEIDGFLNQFKTSGRSYMNKRTSLSIFFSEFVRKNILIKNPISRTGKQKIKAKLHEVYEDEQLKNVLNFLKANYYNLYLCALITYGCMLRPHQEIRLLKRKHLSADLGQIQLSGSENKAGRIRTVFIPEYLKKELAERINKTTNAEANIFTLTSEAFNDDYFKTQWSRAKTQMLKSNLIQKNHTLYSFRHTAAVQVYKRTKDLNILQQLLGHSNMIVTLKYLRGLGEANNEELRNVLPTL